MTSLKLFRMAVLALLLSASTPTARDQAPAAASEASGKNCLWKVKSSENTVFLLGSIHLLKQDAYPLNKVIESAFNNSRKLVLEVDLDTMNSAEAQQLILAKGLLPEGKTLKQTLSPETYRLVSDKVEGMGLAMETVGRLKPWLLTLTLAISKMRQLGYQPQHGIDKHFFDKARQWNKEVVGLETAEFQISLLDEMASNTQEAALLQTLKELDVFEKEFSQIVQAWSSGDSSALEKSLLESFKEYPEVYGKLVTERNKNWTPKIEGLLGTRGNVFVIVGAAHLVGPDGVVELLRKKGHTVEQM